MASTGLLFIPDISGFTQFIHKTEIEHSRYIIQELLEILINANELQLEISEIEGDAILFYRFGKPPGLEMLYNQVEKMFCSFHRHLQQYARRRICSCNACKNADELTLKVIAHQGEFSSYSVKAFSKLIGKDVIAAHQLLKNDIPDHEYWLVTDELFAAGSGFNNLPGWLQWTEGSKATENGTIAYRYSMLSPLKEQIGKEQLPSHGIEGKRTEIFSLEKLYTHNIDKVYSVVADIPHRPLWLDGLNRVEYISGKINQLGTSHHCIQEKGVEVMITSDFQKDEKNIIIEETDQKKSGTCRFHLQKKGEDMTHLTITFFLKKNPFLLIPFNLFMKNKLLRCIEKSMDNLENFLKTPEAELCMV